MVSNSIGSARLPVLEDRSMIAELRIAQSGNACQIDGVG